ncbi:protein eyes shut [Anastrepha obliqua]|uniref:protein eyes shut n=1 Tax=Anastrepha obliqua TaxID=95512 RepID=UPI002409B7F9|nr:protein eyes shut [Anastrepha obliqua]
MSSNWPIYLAVFMLTPALLSAISYHKRNYDLRYANSDVPQWKQRACQKTQREKINLHYICDEKGNVKCLPGWQGDLCQVPQCRKGCDPMNGYCQRPDECRCRIGYTGEFCERCIPLPGCQHGYCNRPFECICKPGWDGLFCTEPTCRSGCHSTRGYCEAPGECRCRLGWAGRTCSDCAVLPGCQHGTCQKPLECNCLPGYTGLLCQTAICATGCHKQRGYCAKPGECRCKVGWTGPNCDQCFPYPGCVNGDCERPWECNCKPGWGGMLCDEKLTYCDEHPNTCENEGRCIPFTKDDGSYRCECKKGYLGKNCEILDEFMLTSTSAPHITPPPMPSWAAEMENNDDDMDGTDVGNFNDGGDHQLGNKVEPTNNAVMTATTAASPTTAATTSSIADNFTAISVSTKPAQAQPQFNRETASTVLTVDKLTNINDIKSTLANDFNNTKPPTSTTEGNVAQLPSTRNTSDVVAAKITKTADTHLNLINATAVTLKSHDASVPSRETEENSTMKSTYLPPNQHTSTSSPYALAAFSSPIPIPLHFLEPTTHNQVTHTVAAVNSNLATPSATNAANEGANGDEYEESDDDDDNEEDDDGDDDDDDEDEDEDEDDEDQLIPDVLNSVA